MPHRPGVVRTRDSLAVPRSAAENPPEHAKVLRSEDREYRDKKARHERCHGHECADVPPGFLPQSGITPERENNETGRRPPIRESLPSLCLCGGPLHLSSPVVIPY